MLTECRQKERLPTLIMKQKLTGTNKQMVQFLDSLMMTMILFLTLCITDCSTTYAQQMLITNENLIVQTHLL